MPKTRLGKWSVRLTIVSLLLLALRWVVKVARVRYCPLGYDIIPTLCLPWSIQPLIFIPIAIFFWICGIAAFFAGVISIIRKGERSAFVFLAVIAIIVTVVVIVLASRVKECRNETGIMKTLSFGTEVTKVDLEKMMARLKIKNGRIVSQRVEGEKIVPFIILSKPEGERIEEKMAYALKEVIDSGKIEKWAGPVPYFGNPQIFIIYFRDKPEENEIAEIKEIVESNSNYYLQRVSQSEANEHLSLDLSLSYDKERSCGWPLLQEFEKTESMIRNYPGIKIKAVRSDSWFTNIDDPLMMH